MSARKVDEALEAMDRAAHEWNRSARLVLRYGNLDDMERLEEAAEWMLYVLGERGKDRASEAVNRRLQREIDKVVVDALADGRWPADGRGGAE